VQGDFIVQVKSNYSSVAVLNSLLPLSNRAKTSQLNKVELLTTDPFEIYKIHIDYNSTNENEFLANLKRDPRILHAQTNKILSYRARPNDPLYLTNQWQFFNPTNPGIDLNMEAAWELSTGGITSDGDTIVVCVLDDGISRHDDIVDNLWKNNLEKPGDGIDNDGNGYIDDYLGWNAKTKNDDIFSDNRHGSSVSGIIGAVGNNAIGVTGVNWKVKLMEVNLTEGSMTEAMAISGYAYPYKMRKLYNETNKKKGAFVVATNSSWGLDKGNPDDAPLWCAFYDSLGSVGIISCTSTTNTDTNVDIAGDLPTACQSNFIIAITNLNRQDLKVTAAGYGRKNIDVGAFGDGTYNITSSNRYSTFSGTSAASPHVAGVVALMYSSKCNALSQLVKDSPSKAALAVKYLLLTNTEFNASLRNISTSQGRLNVFKAMKATQSLCSNCPSPTNLALQQSIDINKLTIKVESLFPSVRTTIRYRKVLDTAWTTVVNTSETLTILNPDLCSEYEFQSSYSCGNTLISDYQYSTYIKSNGCCPKPQSNIVTYLNSTLNLSFSNELGLDKTIFEIRKQDVLKWDTLSLTTDQSFTIDACNLFEYRLSNYCFGGRSSSGTQNINKLPTYCGPCNDNRYCSPGRLDNSSEWIKEVFLDKTKWVSTNDANGFGNYLSYKIPKLPIRSKLPIKVTPGFKGSEYKEFYKVYIDWNQNFIFEKSELAASNAIRQSSLVDSISVPNNAMIGITRMRIILSFENLDLTCGFASDFGEIEDYCVEVIEKSVSVNSIKIEPKFSLLNTMIQDKVEVLFELTSEQKLAFQLLSSEGKPIKNEVRKINQSTRSFIFYVDEGLPSGIYFFIIQSSSVQKTFKVVKL
jgi:subtilisin family serine protease